MLANITFKAYESTKKTKNFLLTEFTLQFADVDSINKVTQAIEVAYEYTILSWAITIDHEYI